MPVIKNQDKFGPDSSGKRQGAQVVSGRQNPPDGSFPTIVHISTSFLNSEGFRRLYSRLKAISDHGYKVILITGGRYQPSPDWDMSGIEVFRAEALERELNPKKDLLAFLQLISILKKLRPTAVHTHLAKAGILGRWAAYCCRVPVILHTVHGPTFAPTLTAPRRRLFRGIEWITGHITDEFVFVGKDLRDEYIRNGVCTIVKTCIIRTGRPDHMIASLKNLSESELETARKSATNGNDHQFLITCVGRITKDKQQSHALRILRILVDRGVDAGLVIVGKAVLPGEVTYLESLKQLAKTLGVEDRVYFTGYRNDVLSIMAANDAFLHTSKFEGLPNVLVEAAMVGKAIVTYAVSGAREVVRDGQTGFVVPQANFVEAADRLYRLAVQPRLALEMGNEASQQVSGKYSESVMIRNKVELYRRIFQSREYPVARPGAVSLSGSEIR